MSFFCTFFGFTTLCNVSFNLLWFRALLELQRPQLVVLDLDAHVNMLHFYCFTLTLKTQTHGFEGARQATKDIQSRAKPDRGAVVCFLSVSSLILNLIVTKQE